jgi:hypothetical protein
MTVQCAKTLDLLRPHTLLTPALLKKAVETTAYVFNRSSKQYGQLPRHTQTVIVRLKRLLQVAFRRMGQKDRITGVSSQRVSAR